MHILSKHYREEFLTADSIARFVLAESDVPGMHPSLILKTNSQILKNLIRDKRFSLLFSIIPPDNYLVYGVRINDDPEHPAVIWTMAERQEELDSIVSFLKIKKCPVYLFNEAMANICWSEVGFGSELGVVKQLVTCVNLCPSNKVEEFDVYIGKMLDNSRKYSLSQLFEAPILGECVWHEVNNYYLTNNGRPSQLAVISEDEGAQQEEIGVWFLDTLSISGAVKNPQVVESGKLRELSDVLVNYSNGCFLLESKSLAVFARPKSPDRAKLEKGVKKHLDKAISQLQGACRNIRKGNKVIDSDGHELDLNRKQPIHCMVLIPDLGLLAGIGRFWEKVIRPFGVTTGDILHVLDPNELRRCVGHAQYLSKKAKKVSPMMAFDFILMERFKASSGIDTPNFNLRLKAE